MYTSNRLCPTGGTQQAGQWKEVSKQVDKGSAAHHAVAQAKG